jgi:hypothetical protein
MKMSEVAAVKATRTTVVITMKVPLRYRIRLALVLLPEPWRKKGELWREYRAWSRSRMFGSSRYNKLRFILDHSIFWPYYLLVAVAKGEARGFSWTTEEEVSG